MASAELGPIVALLRSLREPEGTPLNVARTRMALEAMAAPPPNGVAVERTNVAGRAAEWLVPSGADTRVRLLYLHGGAYIAGSIATHRALAGRVARAAGCVALVPDYRLAPEHPFPAAPDDAFAALSHLRHHGPGGAESEATHVLVAGDSAGGGLALVTLLAARDASVPVTAAALLSPWTDLAATGESLKTRRALDPFLDPDLVGPAGSLYLHGHDARDPRASPLYAALGGLPRLLIHVGEWEILRDDSTRFAERARAAGVHVTLEEWPEMIHVWHAFAAVLPEARTAIARVGEFLSARTR